jgi:hypothetical protein
MLERVRLFRPHLCFVEKLRALELFQALEPLGVVGVVGYRGQQHKRDRMPNDRGRLQKPLGGRGEPIHTRR